MKNMGLLTVLIPLVMVLITSCYCEHYGRVVFTAKKKPMLWTHHKPVIYVNTKYLVDDKKFTILGRENPTETLTPSKVYLSKKKPRSKKKTQKDDPKLRRATKAKSRNANKSKLRNATKLKKVVDETNNKNKTVEKMLTSGDEKGELLEPTHVTTDLPDLKEEETNIVETKTPKSNKIRLQWNDSVINFYFDTTSYDSIVQKKVVQAFKQIEDASCLKFKPFQVKPLQGSLNWIHITNPNHDRKCQHEAIPTENGEIVLTLGLDCLRQQQILHTLLHAIGVQDEISHPARGRYVRVMFDNIIPEYQHLFAMQEYDEQVPTVEFDPKSVMQFHDRAYSKNGRATIAVLMPGLQITPSEKLSHLDKLKLRVKFERICNKNQPLKTCKRPGSENNNNTTVFQAT